MSSNKADQRPRPESRPRVLVLGGGFAGIGAARKLRKADVDVVVIDGHDYHTFQPLFYQVATDLLPHGTVGHPLRDLFDDQPNARVHTTEVTSVDLDKHEVGFAARAGTTTTVPVIEVISDWAERVAAGKDWR